MGKTEGSSFPRSDDFSHEIQPLANIYYIVKKQSDKKHIILFFLLVPIFGEARLPLAPMNPRHWV
jgi:hypothetical protein